MGEEYNTFLCAYAMEMIMRDRKNYKYWMLHAVSIRAWLKAHHADTYEQLLQLPAVRRRRISEVSVLFANLPHHHP